MLLNMNWHFVAKAILGNNGAQKPHSIAPSLWIIFVTYRVRVTTSPLKFDGEFFSIYIYILGIIIPTDFHIFQRVRGVQTTKQIRTEYLMAICLDRSCQEQMAATNRRIIVAALQDGYRHDLDIESSQLCQFTLADLAAVSTGFPCFSLWKHFSMYLHVMISMPGPLCTTSSISCSLQEQSIRIFMNLPFDSSHGQK